MKIRFIVAYFVALHVLCAASFAAPAPRQRLLLDDGWKFVQADAPGAEQPGFDDHSWRALNLPHDWSIEGEFKRDAPTIGNGGYLPAGIGWYRKHLALPGLPKGQTAWIEFDGVYMNSDVWVNGHHLGRHAYGYTSFYYDLTPYLAKGENLVAVRVDNAVQPNSRWYSGSGIYRHVWLHTAPAVHIAQWGSYVTTPRADSAAATVAVRTAVVNTLGAPQNVVLRSVLQDRAGRVVATVETPVALPAGATTETTQTAQVAAPALWSIEKPALYTVRSSIVAGKKVVDGLNTPFGIRTIAYDKDHGFLLNGQRVKMHGVCLHHDGGCLGAAVPEQAWVRRLQLLKAMGCNAIRTAHNPPAPEFLDLCDRLGFVVMDEAFDEWEIAKGQVGYSYHLHFDKDWQSDLLSMVRRDRNHPCVVMWSAGNEVLDQGQDRGVEVLRNLLDAFHREDPTRPVTVANDRIADVDYPAKPAFLQLQDVVGYNYVDRWLNRRELYYGLDKHDHPDWRVIGTENASIPSVRGRYALPSDTARAGRGPNYRSGMVRAEQLWKFTAVHDYVIGDFMWAGIDFLGEANWPSKNSAAGVLDLAGFPKDSYYFYQSQWTAAPMVHAFPHWNWAGHEGEVIPVVAYTNCDKVELFVNGKSFGSKSAVFPQQGNSGGNNKFARPYVAATTSDLHLSWDVPYAAGTLKLVGQKDGQTVTEEIHTTGPPAAVRLSADRPAIAADAWDVASIRAEIVDANGRVVPDAANALEFSVAGAGTIAGTDNGNPQDKTAMQSPRRSAFAGLALAVVRSTKQSGTVRLTAASPGLAPATIEISTRKPAAPPRP